MAECKWPGGCKLKNGKADVAVKNSIYCDKHRRKHDEDEKIKREKEQMAKQLEERKEKQEEMARIAKAKQEAADLRKEKIQQIKTQWNQQVQAVAKQVRDLRSHNPGVSGINAGKNTGIGDTPGGSDNQLELKLPSDAKGIAKGDIYPLMTGFDGSDSAGVKIRIPDPNGNILVHVH